VRIKAEANHYIRDAITKIVATDPRCARLTCVIEGPTITVDKDVVRKFSTTSAKISVRALNRSTLAPSEGIAHSELRYTISSANGEASQFNWLHYYFKPHHPLASLDKIDALQISPRLLSECQAGKQVRLEWGSVELKTLICGVGGKDNGHLIHKAIRPLDLRSQSSALEGLSQ
jgi:hypothetical protein